MNRNDSHSRELIVSAGDDSITTERFDELADRLAGIEEKLDRLLTAKRTETVQEFYSTADVARILNKAEWTVREWCRLGRVYAQKRECGRGCAKEWMISHEELLRIKCEGLLPIRGYIHRAR